MALYTLADLHLAADVAKPMDIFGGRWQGHTERSSKLACACCAGGHHCFGRGYFVVNINLAEAKGDFCADRLAAGQKDHFEGNHDLGGNALKMRFLEENGFTTIDFLHNNCFFYEKTALCSTRGWPFEEDFADPHNEKIFCWYCCGSRHRCFGWRRRPGGDTLFPALSAALRVLPLR